MPIRRVWAKEQNLAKRVLATCLSRVRAVLLVSCVLRFSYFPLLSMEGRNLVRAVAMSATVSWRVVPAWPMGMHTRSTHPRYRRRAQRRGWYFAIFLVSLCLQPRFLHKPISKRVREYSLRSKEAGLGRGRRALLGRR